MIETKIYKSATAEERRVACSSALIYARWRNLEGCPRVAGFDDITCLQIDLMRWERKNFGLAKSYTSALGVIEEVGELEDAQDDEDEWADAIGDIMIFACNLCSKNGLDFGTMITAAWCQTSAKMKGMLGRLGKLAHVILKADQGIRHYADRDVARRDIGIVLYRVVSSVVRYARMCGHDPREIMGEVAREVMKREWWADPSDGGIRERQKWQCVECWEVFYVDAGPPEKCHNCGVATDPCGQQRSICTGCNKEIDPDCCGCGSSLADHTHSDNHPFIPMGCDCHRDGFTSTLRSRIVKSDLDVPAIVGMGSVDEVVSGPAKFGGEVIGFGIVDASGRCTLDDQFAAAKDESEYVLASEEVGGRGEVLVRSVGPGRGDLKLDKNGDLELIDGESELKAAISKAICSHEVRTSDGVCVACQHCLTYSPAAIIDSTLRQELGKLPTSEMILEAIMEKFPQIYQLQVFTAEDYCSGNDLSFRLDKDDMLIPEIDAGIRECMDRLGLQGFSFEVIEMKS